MQDFEEADQRLMDWLAERTDTQLQRLLDAPEDGLTNATFSESDECKCLAGWATDCAPASAPRGLDTLEATGVLVGYGLSCDDSRDDGTIMRRIQRFAAAELLTRRVERKALPAPTREAVNV